MTMWLANFMEQVLDFSNILNVSIAASWMVLAIIVLRFLLKKAPKWTHVALWGLLAARLLLPFSMESTFSLIPSVQTIPPEILRYEGPRLNQSAHLDIVSNPIFSGDVSIELEQTVDRIQVRMVDMTFVWLIGITMLFLYTAISYWRLRRKVDTAVLYKANIFQSENVVSPFVLGIIKPKIYLPFKLDGKDLEHVVSHEQAHIHRKDHWWKPLGFFLLTIHWFNPLMWLAYVLLCRDIELACDEKVIKQLDNEQRADYTQSLVACSINRRIIAACPLAFGEVGVKNRVKSVMNYKKPAFRVISMALISCMVVAVCFLTNPKEPTLYDTFSQNDYIVLEQKQVDLTLAVPKSAFSDAIYTSKGQNFKKEEVIAYRTDTTTIYLYKIMLSNESDDLLYFIFDCSYDFPNYGNLISPFSFVDADYDSTKPALNLRSKDLKDKESIYPDAVSMRGYGPGTQFAFYVSKDACEAANGELIMDIVSNQITYAKSGYEDEASLMVPDDILDVFRNNISDNETVIVTDHVYADDKAYGLDGIVQYTDETGSPWMLSFIRDGIAYPVSQDWGTDYVIASELTYLGNGTVQVYVQNINTNIFHVCTMTYSYDAETNHTNFKATSKETQLPK